MPKGRRLTEEEKKNLDEAKAAAAANKKPRKPKMSTLLTVEKAIYYGTDETWVKISHGHATAKAARASIASQIEAGKYRIIRTLAVLEAKANTGLFLQPVPVDVAPVQASDAPQDPVLTE